jgi:glycosyltransferase involved in cell wall biosynthesis
MNGLESRPVMPGPPMPDDDVRLIRTDYKNLSNPAWWQSQAPGAVILFSWAMPIYTPTAAAIKASGAKLMVFLDTAGFWSPRSSGHEWYKAHWDACRRKKGVGIGALRFAASIVRSFIPAAFDRPRLNHMNLADILTVTSPLVLQRTQRYARVYGYESLAERMFHLPLPVAPHMRYEGQEKRKRVICVARWLPQDWPEKGPALLLASLCRFLNQRPDYEAIVVGRGACSLRNTGFYPNSLDRQRLELVDYLPNKDIASLLAQCRISVCSSFHESYHIASFEAACCGCSIVALKSPDLPALQSLAETNGTLADKENPKAFADALFREAEAWDRGLRNPGRIARHWQAQTHANEVASKAIQLLELRTVQ